MAATNNNNVAESGVVAVPKDSGSLPEGIVPYGTVFADGEMVDAFTDKEIVGSLGELLEGVVPATSWRGV
jgi:hypothetical protein